MRWDDSKPIYLQIKDKITISILERSLQEGDVLSSVRQVSAEYRVNHLTVAKAYQQLVEENVLERRRGVGMFVKEGSYDVILQEQKKQFVEKEWPDILKKIARLGLQWGDLQK